MLTLIIVVIVLLAFGWAKDKIKARWFKSEVCKKTELGYTCHHRVLTNGQKECGQ